MVTDSAKGGKSPRVVALGRPKYAGEDYIADFSNGFEYSVLDAYDRKQTKELLAADVAANGPISAFIIRNGTLPYEP